MEKEFYRVVIRNAKTGETELIIWQSKDFAKCLEEARKIVNKGVDAGQVDILSLNSAGLWENMWEVEGAKAKGVRYDLCQC